MLEFRDVPILSVVLSADILLCSHRLDIAF